LGSTSRLLAASAAGSAVRRPVAQQPGATSRPMPTGDEEQRDSDEHIEQICRCAQLQVDEVTYAEQVTGERAQLVVDRRTLSNLQEAAQGLDGLSAAGRRRASETLLRPSLLPLIVLELPLAAETGADGRLLLRIELPRGYPLLVPPLLSIACAAGAEETPAFALALGTAAAVQEAMRLRESGVDSCLCELMEWATSTLTGLLRDAAAAQPAQKPKLTDLIRPQQQRDRELEPEPEPEPELEPEPEPDLVRFPNGESVTSDALLQFERREWDSASSSSNDSDESDDSSSGGDDDDGSLGKDMRKAQKIARERYSDACASTSFDCAAEEEELSGGARSAAVRPKNQQLFLLPSNVPT
jgi:hypothetical protein